MKLQLLLLCCIATLAAAADTTIVFRHHDAEHLNWDLERHLQVALHNAHLELPQFERFNHKGVHILRVVVPEQLFAKFVCALRASDEQLNYWIDHLAPMDKKEEWHVQSDTETKSGHSWRTLLQMLKSEVSASECSGVRRAR
jgi:hypothetical protein